MTQPNNQPLADPQKDELIKSLKDEIPSLKSQVKKNEEKIETVDNMLNTTVECSTAKILLGEIEKSYRETPAGCSQQPENPEPTVPLLPGFFLRRLRIPARGSWRFLNILCS